MVRNSNSFPEDSFPRVLGIAPGLIASRSPSSLDPSFGEGSPTKIEYRKNRVPTYSKLSTGGPRFSELSGPPNFPWSPNRQIAPRRSREPLRGPPCLLTLVWLRGFPY